jgi:hydrogenase expression/formation protein HypE
MNMHRPFLDERVAMKHGAGGRAMRSLVENVFLRELAEFPVDGFGLSAMDDGAALRVGDRWLIVTTDSHVVQPIFFPGGDIGRLAVSGTVNDLAMMGATEPLALTLAVVLEAGFPRAALERIQASIVATCKEAGAPVVTGDTKVMGKGELDGIVLNTAGVAFTDRIVRDNGLRPGDRILVTGNLGDHGLAILAARHQLGLDGDLRSDVQPINSLIRAALSCDGAITAMKDPTRGGLSSALGEMAEKSGVGIVLDEASLPISVAARAAGELLGIDPLHVANEGKAVMGVRADRAEEVLAAVRAHPIGRDAALIGVVTGEHVGRVVLDTGVGRRLLAEPEGDPMPRIC